MRVLIQRVTRAQATEAGASKPKLASIERGMLCLIGFEEGDSPIAIEQMVQKIKALRIFSDSQNKLNLAGNEVKAQYLLVSQFTLYAECKYGNRPSFDKAAPKVKAGEWYQHCVKVFERLMGTEHVKHTPFASDLHLELVNDGPVTIWLDSKAVL